MSAGDGDDAEDSKRATLARIIDREACAGTPCPDCPYSLAWLAGKQQLLLRCDWCNTWYETRVASGDGDVFVELGACVPPSRKNALFRCDVMARYTHVHTIPNGVCPGCYMRRHGRESQLARRYDAQVFNQYITLAELLRHMVRRSYRQSRLPAYSIQRRCGAVPAYTWAYVQFASARSVAATNQYLTSRLHLIRTHDAQLKKPGAPTPEPIPYDAVAAAREAVETEEDREGTDVRRRGGRADRD